MVKLEVEAIKDSDNNGVDEPPVAFELHDDRVVITLSAPHRRISVRADDLQIVLAALKAKVQL